MLCAPRAARVKCRAGQEGGKREEGGGEEGGGGGGGGEFLVRFWARRASRPRARPPTRPFSYLRYSYSRLLDLLVDKSYPRASAYFRVQIEPRTSADEARRTYRRMDLGGTTCLRLLV